MGGLFLLKALGVLGAMFSIYNGFTSEIPFEDAAIILAASLTVIYFAGSEDRGEEAEAVSVAFPLRGLKKGIGIKELEN